ncbi:MAG: KAP family NTPase [Clostridia bacterium]|nr:KAP family NTPase [Clostridia bacterium]
METVEKLDDIKETKSIKKIDYLQREDYICDIYNIAMNLSRDKSNISFAIDGEWGCGKTFLLEMIEEELKECQSEETNNDRFAVFHYNCWQYDYYEEPLVAIVSMMINQIEKSENLLTTEQKKKTLAVLKGVGTVVLAGLNNKIEDKTGVNVKAILDEIKKIEEGTKETLDNIRNFDPFWSFNQALDSMRKSLKEIAKDKTIVFVVDELDRCLPQYAIKVLERLHHITEGIDNFITIIAIDKKRLLHSIANAFGYDKNGENKDSEKYLKKFIKFVIPLHAGFIDVGISKKYEKYISMFDELLYDCVCLFDDYFSELFNEINMREQEQLMAKIELAHCIIADPSRHYDYTVMYMELLLAVFCTHYKVELEDIDKELLKFDQKDNLMFFRENFKLIKSDYENNTFNRKPIKIIKDDFSPIVHWYSSFLKECDFSGNLSEDLKCVDGLSRDTSNVEGINMEDNLKFLYHFYQELIKL